MAPRRVVTSRSRSQTGGENALPQLSTRPKPVIARIQRSVPAIITSEPPLVLPSTSSLAQSRPVAKVQAPHQSQEECEINIQVVVRSRRRSDREVQESSPIIVTTEGARSHAVSIKTAAPVSSLGVITPPPTRPYPSHLAFSPQPHQPITHH